MMAGQPLDIRNSDPLLHNVHGLPFTNREFNRAQPVKGQIDRFKLTLPEVPVMIKCEVHPWMRTWACVVDNPFYAVTDAAGKFEIKNLPTGKYKLGVWHEGLDTVDKTNEVAIELKSDKKLQVLMLKK